MIKRMIIMLALCAIFLGGIFGFKYYGSMMMMKHMAQMGSMPQTVSTTKVAYGTWKPTLKAVGTLRAAQGADLSAEVAGIVENIFIESGQDVTEGTILLQMRSKDDQARLEGLIAQKRLAETTLARDKKQLTVQAISQAKYDADEAQLNNLKAQVETQRALLEKKTITAPFSGRLGIRRVDVGQFVNVGAPVVTLQQLDPIYFDFFIPQQKLGEIEVGQKVTLKSDTIQGKAFEGEITAINSKVNEETRNIEVRATFTNKDKLLKPGMFATAKVDVGQEEKHLTLPQTAITFNPYGSTVFVVTKNGEGLVANTAFVETGMTRGDQVTILSGIKEGDEIVTAGQLKLRNGSFVTINNKLQPSNDSAPMPVDK